MDSKTKELHKNLRKAKRELFNAADSLASVCYLLKDLPEARIIHQRTDKLLTFVANENAMSWEAIAKILNEV